MAENISSACTGKPSLHFMTLFYGELDRVQLLLRWVNTGHDPAILYDSSTGQFQKMQGHGMALGVLTALVIPSMKETFCPARS
jgi:serine phosphatase RsbU (regulator of sigma subunit)